MTDKNAHLTSIQIPAVNVNPDRIRKPQPCELTAADSPLSATQSLNDVQCIVGNVVYGLCVHHQDIPYEADTVTNISVFSEGEKDEERKQEPRYTAEEDNHDKGTHQHFRDRSEF